jgi:hypothetical protein
MQKQANRKQEPNKGKNSKKQQNQQNLINLLLYLHAIIM